jgi:extracellular elastinolytic metalloproteinase
MAAPEPKIPGNFHALYDRAARAARGVAMAAAPAEPPAVARMAAEVPSLAVHLDEATNNSVQVTTDRTAGRLSTRAAASPEAAARQFVQDRADLWQLTAQDVKTVDVVSVSTSGLPTVAVLTIEGTDDANHDIHSPRDTLDRINFDLALEILRMNTAFVAGALSAA